MPESNEKNSLNNSVAKTITILNCFSYEKPRLRIKEISAMTGISQPTVHRLLNILREFNLTEQRDGIYSLGSGFLKYEGIVLKSMEIRRICLPYLEELSNLLRINTNLVMLENNEAVFIARAETPYGEYSYFHIGMKRPVHCTAVGKVLVCKSPELIHEIFKHGVRRYTLHTIIDETQFLKEAEKIRLQGYATDFEEWSNGINCAAAPIFNAAGDIVAGISISGAASVHSAEKMKEYIPHIIEYSNRISSRVRLLEDE